MSLNAFVGLLGFLLILAFAANRLARRTGVPDILVLMATGLLLGPTLHWIDAAKFEPATRGFGTLALILIIFEAGLDLKLRETLRYFPAGLFLSVVTYALSTAAVTEICILVLGLSRHDALLAGATLGCMSSAVVLPVLQQVDLRDSARVTLMVEAAFGDALGVLTVGSLLGTLVETSGAGIRPTPRVLLGGLAGNFTLKILLSMVIALAAGLLWSRLLPYLSDQRSWHLLTLGAVLILYAVADLLHGSDLFAVMVFGVVLANLPVKGITLGGVRILAPPGAHAQTEILSFHSELGFLVRTFFFVLIGAIIRFGELRRAGLISLTILCALFIIRVVSVQIGRMAWHGSTRRERELACLMIPRGLVTAVLALKVAEARGPKFEFLIPLAFGLILLTNLLLLVGTLRMRATSSPATMVAVVATTSVAVVAVGAGSVASASEPSAPEAANTRGEE
jgi:cell volume regulation protein A